MRPVSDYELRDHAKWARRYRAEAAAARSREATTSKLSGEPLPLSDVPRPIPGQLILFPLYTGK